MASSACVNLELSAIHRLAFCDVCGGAGSGAGTAELESAAVQTCRPASFLAASSVANVCERNVRYAGLQHAAAAACEQAPAFPWHRGKHEQVKTLRRFKNPPPVRL